MLKLRVIQAKYGDCLILECGSGKRWQYLLIDGGPSGVYRSYLRPELEQIMARGGKLGLVVLTHVDSDHVIGLVDLLRDIKNLRLAGKPEPVQIAGMWHNAFDRVMPEVAAEAAAAEETVSFNIPDDEAAATSYGIGDGEVLQAGDAVLGIPRNAGFPGAEALVSTATAAKPVRLLGMKLWVLGPTPENLAALRKSWLAWLAERRGEVSFGVEAAIEPDDSVNNLSSIILLAEAGRGKTKRSYLLTGDCLGSDVVSGLEQAGLLKPGETFHVDVLKLPHHGSARNVIGPKHRPEDFFDRVLADTYIISADGRHGNPDWETLCWLTDASRRQQRQIEIFATNRTPSLARLLIERPEADYCYHLTIMPSGAKSAVL